MSAGPRTPKAARGGNPEWMLATQPGLGRRLAERIGGETSIESDGRSDLVVVASSTPPDPVRLGAEDLFLLISEATRRKSANDQARALFDASLWQRSLDVARDEGLTIGGKTRFRVIARVRSEEGFKRTDLRDAVASSVIRWRPRWRISDPADLELWVVESRRGRFRLGVRLSSANTRQRLGRVAEYEGALRPVVAADMVAEAGAPLGILLDPFCGSGTILAEGALAGWRCVGSDVDDEAVQVARRNVPGAEIARTDVTALRLADSSVGAVVTNAPFGKKHLPVTDGRTQDVWWKAVFAELTRVLDGDGVLVILHPGGPAFEGATESSRLHVMRRARITTLGLQATIWTLRRKKRRRGGDLR